MQPKRTLSLMKITRVIFAGWLVLWMLLSSVLAASPALHEKFHDGAGDSSHQCAVTLIEQQQLVAAELHTLIVILDGPEAKPFVPVVISFVSHDDVPLLPGRAPPSLS